MVKGSSLLLVGTGIVISSIFSIIIDLVNPQNIFDDLEYFSDLDMWISFLVLGGLLMFIGGPKFINEKQKNSEKLEAKPVSLVWQVIGSAFPGFDLLVMYRIKKLRLGSIVFASQFAIWGTFSLSDISADTDTIIGLLVGIGYSVVVYVWSKKWNEQFSENSVNEELKMRKTLMVKREPVNINWQIVFAIIPYVQFYAAYRVEKFRLFFLLWIVIGACIAVFNFFAGERIPYMSYAVGIPIYVVLIRKWSKEWNEQISKRILNANSEDDFSSRTALG